MSPFFRSLIISIAAIFASGIVMEAQTPEQEARKKEQEFYDSITSMVDKLTDQLDLNDAQIFYADSILSHDYKAMQDELQELSNKKVSNTSIYYNVQDKWQDQIYYAFQKILDEDQWAKYLKNGAERAKKSRDKRREKSNK